MTEHNNKDLEVNQTSPQMQIFFRKLLDLKIYVEAARDISNHEVIKNIYKKLDEIIKQGK